MANKQERRERIAAQVLSGLAACGSDCTLAGEVQLAVRIADELIAELDRTAPLPQSNQPEKPEGWVIWDDSHSVRPVRDRHRWHAMSVEPFQSEAEAGQVLCRYGTDGGLRVRRWPLDPSEDKEVQS